MTGTTSWRITSRCVGAAVAALTAAAALAVAVPATAHAATGTFQYYFNDPITGPTRRGVTNPVDYVCYRPTRFGGAPVVGTQAVNSTNRTARVYSSTNCGGPVGAVVLAGADKVINFSSFQVLDT
ncbi:hypothetical protein [Actinomadura roseirufa]|uniref:hypothetical protein n=1 Tax=Actinomadura roseirufa TaxID=2094049 RepID=UPI0010413414|nr:hypothetical protein [Actinomadura roseirufa]